MTDVTDVKSADSQEPKIVAFLCNWCSYAGADLAGVSRFQYPANIRVIRVPCSVRINPKFILAALRHGADGVFCRGLSRNRTANGSRMVGIGFLAALALTIAAFLELLAAATRAWIISSDGHLPFLSQNR